MLDELTFKSEGFPQFVSNLADGTLWNKLSELFGGSQMAEKDIEKQVEEADELAPDVEEVVDVTEELEADDDFEEDEDEEDEDEDLDDEEDSEDE